MNLLEYSITIIVGLLFFLVGEFYMYLKFHKYLLEKGYLIENEARNKQNKKEKNMYPRYMDSDEMIEWIEKSKTPLFMRVTQIDEDTIILQRIDS